MKREQDFSFCKQNNQNNSDHYDKSSALFETVFLNDYAWNLCILLMRHQDVFQLFVSTERRYLNQNMTFY